MHERVVFSWGWGRVEVCIRMMVGVRRAEREEVVYGAWEGLPGESHLPTREPLGKVPLNDYKVMGYCANQSSFLFLGPGHLPRPGMGLFPCPLRTLDLYSGIPHSLLFNTAHHTVLLANTRSVPQHLASSHPVPGSSLVSSPFLHFFFK